MRIALLLLFISTFSFSQTNEKIINKDSLTKKHSPRLAATFSAILPGLGQAYNKKYWKIPIIYIGIGSFAYLSLKNNEYYNNFKKAYKELYETNPNGYYYLYNTTYTLSGLEAGKNYYRRYRDLYSILTVGVYVLNIIDATVDAYLFDFDVSDNLSLNISPTPLYADNKYYNGIKICFYFKK
jgi:hypothetical protein